MEYTELSAQCRDVLLACASLHAELECTMTGTQIRTKTASLRDEPATDYTYEVISKLNDEGWLEQTPANDERVSRYTLTSRAKADLSERGAMMIRCIRSLSEPDSGSQSESDENKDGRIKAPPETLAAEIEDTSADAV